VTALEAPGAADPRHGPSEQRSGRARCRLRQASLLIGLDSPSAL